MTLPATSLLCGIYTFLFAGSPLFYSPSPRGFCPSCCKIQERDDIKFLLYTRENLFNFQYLYLSDETHLRKSNFNFNYPLAIYLHGFSESATGERQSSQEVKDAFLKSENYNVILIDWSPLAAVPWYINAVDNLPIVAKYVARFIHFLLQQGYEMQKIHLIGFSLGAEVAGFIGKQLKEWGVYLPRITGLDPALPLFEYGSSNRHLSPKDAKFVDIIHTDGGILGNSEAMGHADFYPNGGHGVQPGCARQEIANKRWLSIIIGCSHQRAWEYFVESIRRPFAFPANRCEPSKLFGTCRDGNGKTFMGMGADTRLRGKFFLNTNDESPYGVHTLSSPTNSVYKHRKAALTSLPAYQGHLHEELQQLQTNAITENVKVNGTLKAVDNAIAGEAIKSKNMQKENLILMTARARGAYKAPAIEYVLPTADVWNSVSSNENTNLET